MIIFESDVFFFGGFETHGRRERWRGGGGYKPLTRHLCFNASTPDILHQSVKKTG